MLDQIRNSLKSMMLTKYAYFAICIICWLFVSADCPIGSHQRLLGKIKHYSISGTTLAWISDFLSGRTQQIVVDGSYSEWFTVHSGVPQGTTLGPFSFYYILTTYQIVSIAGSGCLPTIVWCTGKLAALKTSLHSREIWMPSKFGQALGVWNLTQVNVPFFQSQDPPPCINFILYVALCFSM